MDVISLFVVTGIIIFLGFIGEIVFKKTNIPDVIWLILFGIIIGSVLNLVRIDGSEFLASLFTTFALIFILFEGAINIDIRELFKGLAGGTGLALMNFILSVAIVTVIGLFMGVSPVLGLLLGVILAGTSSAVVIPIIKRLKVKKEASSMLMIESAVSDVLCIIAAVTVIEAVTLAQLDVSSSFNTLIGSFAIALFIGILAGFLWIQVLKWVGRQSKSYMITIAFLLLLYSFIEFAQGNGAIGALAFGLILGNSKRIFKAFKKSDLFGISSGERFFYSEISFFVKSFFFVYIGILIDFSSWLPFVLALIISVALFLVRPFAVYPVSRKLDEKSRAVMESLVPKGLASAVLVQLAIQHIPEASQFASIVLAVIFLTIIFSSVFVFLIERGVYPGLGRVYSNLLAKQPEEAEE